MKTKWLIDTSCGDILELVFRPDREPFPFTLFVGGLRVSPAFKNVGEVKDTLKDFGWTVVEFLQTEGDQFPIQPCKSKEQCCEK